MAESREVRETREDHTPVRRISWGAIIAGIIIVLMIQITLGILGLAVGFSSVDPTTEQQPMYGFFTGEMIWWVISGLIALFVGGWAASRLSGLLTGILHGIVTWGLVELIFIYLLTSAIGSIIGGALGVVQTGLSAAGQAVPQVISAIDLPEGADSSLQQVQKEIKKILKQTETKALKPEQLEEKGEEMTETAKEAAGEAVQKPQQAYDEIMQAFKKMMNKAEAVISDVDKEAVVNVLVKRTDMSRQEAQTTMDNWIETYNQALKEAKQMKKQAGQTMEEVGEKTAEAIASAAWWSFFMLVLGAIAAAGGGALGTRFPDNRHKERKEYRKQEPTTTS